MEPFLENLVSHVGRWLEVTTRESDVVVSTRIRLARNIPGFPFPSRIPNGRAEEIESILRKKIVHSKISGEMLYTGLADSSPICRQTLLERHLISRELAGGKHKRGVAFDRSESVSIMVNEEDHLRLQVIQPGFDLEACWREMRRIDHILESQVEFSYSDDFGYLTACPTNVGTGLRVSVMFHLPGLAIAEKELKRVFNAAAKTNFAVRGLHGEGTKAIGDFFQISNQITLGRSEWELLEDLQSTVPQIVDFERKVRQTLLEGQKSSLEDRVYRALGIMRSARSIASEEAITHLSSLRLGVTLGLLSDIDLPTIHKLLVLIQPGHLQARAKKELSPEERDAARATLIRKIIEEKD